MQNRWWPGGILSASRLKLPELSAPADRRLQALEMWRRTGCLRDVCEVFRVSRASMYRWKQNFDPDDLSKLEPRSRRPRRVRQPQWNAPLVRAVHQLRREYPRWGKHKLVVLLQRQGVHTSESSVGRILKHLRRRGILVDPPRRSRTGLRATPRPWAKRCPGGPPRPQTPGELVQLDTLNLRPLSGLSLRHFGARDVVSRWDVLEVHHRATSRAAEHFLETVEKRMSFPLRALQIDGGSEFKGAFSRRPVRSAPSRSTYCHPTRPSSTASSRGPMAPTARSFTK